MRDALESAAPEIPELENLLERIRKAPRSIWTRLRAALGAADKDAAVELVRTDPEARKIASVIVGVETEAPLPQMSTPQSTGPTSRRGGKAGLKIEG